jgi:hypothetical protein
LKQLSPARKNIFFLSQTKFSHVDVEGSVKAGKALSHLLTRSSDELSGEIQRVKGMEQKRYGGRRN